jgi:hypothetical protein
MCLKIYSCLNIELLKSLAFFKIISTVFRLEGTISQGFHISKSYNQCWKYGSSAPALQVQSREFKPQYHAKKKKKLQSHHAEST